MNRSFCSDFITTCVYPLTVSVASLPHYTHQVIRISKKSALSTFATISVLVTSKQNLYSNQSYL
jgi:ABC-type arginine/histidine transport system permease subunit